MNISDNRYCLICGKDNPIGLKAHVQVDEQAHSATCRVAVPAEFQGWQGIVHGGIIGALLDEVCVHAGMTVAMPVVTGELKTRYRKPVPVEQMLTISARVTAHQRRTLTVEAELAADGMVLASAMATMVVVVR